MDTAIVGRSLRLNGIPTTVIGVMQRGFSFPDDQHLWTPLIPTQAALKRDTFYARYAFGRMAGGATIQGARAEMETIGSRLATAHPRSNRGVVPLVRNFDEWFIGANATMLYKAMWGAVGFVLLIACANLANLLLGRAAGRSREISVRIALGAGRWRIIRQLLIESLMLSGLGGVFGWWIAKIGVRVYALAQISGNTTRVLSYTMDYPVLAYLIAISIGTGILVGFAAASRLTKLDVNGMLKDGSRGVAGERRGRRLSSVLVGGEVALAVVLLTGAGVMIRSFVNVYTADMGVSTGNILTTSLYISPDDYPTVEARISFYDRLKARLEALPGVESAATASVPPTEDAGLAPYELAGATPAVDESRPTVPALIVSPDYFRTLGAAIRFGREFNDFDQASAPPVVIVNQRFANGNWPGENPVGKRLRLFREGRPEAWLTVVGVASNIVQNDATRQDFEPLAYLPYRQRPQPQGNMFVFARTRVPPESLAAALRREVNALDPALPVPVLMPLAERLHQASAFQRNVSVLFLIFAVIALLLASVGLYAVIAHSVSRRTQEIGIRMAMGATARDIRRLILQQGMLPLLIGLIIGLAGSLAVNRLLKAELVQVSPTDPITLIIASAALILAAMLGCLIPARRAMRVDPIAALRHE